MLIKYYQIRKKVKEQKRSIRTFFYCVKKAKNREKIVIKYTVFSEIVFYNKNERWCSDL